MKDGVKTKAQPINELIEMRQRIAELEALEIQHQREEEMLRQTQAELRRQVKKQAAALVKAKEKLQIEKTESEQVEELVNLLIVAGRTGITAVRTTADAISVVSPVDGRLIFCNNVFLKQWKIKGDYHNLHYDDWFDITSESNVLKKVVQATMAGGWSGELTGKAMNGQTFPIHVNTAPVVNKEGSVVGLLGIFKDVTEQKRIEEEKRRLIATVEQSIDGIAICDLEPTLIYVNDAYARMHGYSPEEMIGMKVVNLHNEEQMDRYERAIKQIKTRGSWQGEIGHIRKDGTAFPTYMSVTLLKDGDGKPTGIAAVARDITERKQAVEALRESEERFRSVVQSANDAIISASSSGNITFWNKAAQEMFGYTGEEVLGQPLTILMSERYRDAYQRGMERIRSTGESRLVGKTVELSGLRKDGSEFPFEISLASWQVGEEAFYTSIIRDITERKRAEAALQENEERYRAFFNTSRDWVFITTKDGRWVDFNDGAVEFFGYENSDELRKVSIPELYENPEERERVTQTIEQQGFAEDLAVNFRRNDGSIINTLLTAAVRKDENGDVIGYQGTVKDITERKQAEEALKESEEKYRALVDVAGKAGESIVVVQDTEDAQGAIVFVNEEFPTMLGYSQQELLGKAFHQFISPDSLKTVAERYRRRQKGEDVPSRYEIMALHKDGTAVPIDVAARAMTFRGKPATVAYGRDITERKRAEEVLLKNRNLLNETGEMAKVGGWEFDTDTLEQTWTEEIYRIHELDMDYQPTVEKGINFYAPEAVPIISEAVQRTIDYGEPFDLELPFITAKGNHRWVHAIGKAYRKDGKTIKVSGTFQDITERKQAEEALRESEEKYRTLINNIKIGVFRSSPEPGGRFLEVNAAMEQITGYRREELLQMNAADLYVNPAERKQVLEEVTSGKGRAAREVRFRKKDGTEIVILDRKTAVRNEAGEVIYFDGIMEDLTEHKKVEEKTREAESLKELDRMRTELLSNVSHELRTPLATIKGYATMLLDYDKRLRHGEKRKYLRFIDRASDRLVGLIDQLLDMSRLEAGLVEITKKPASISKLIKEAVDEAYVRKPKRRLVMNLPRRLPRLNIDAKRVRQVLDNLIDNAIKYSEEETEIVISAHQLRRKLVISVADQGIGIPSDDLPKVFERIYRARQKQVIEVGGAGLGLSICQKLVEAHKGKIWIESKEGQGTTASFNLPLATPKKRGQCKKA